MKGLVGIRSTFVRSTKFNDAARAAGELPPAYRVRATPDMALEGVLALYCAAGLYLAVRQRIFWLVPFHLLSLCGFGFVFAWTIGELWRRGARNPTER